MEPLIEIFVEPKVAADRDRLTAALKKLEAADGTFTAGIDAESGMTVLRGRDEPQLEGHLATLRRQGLDLLVGAPQVAYREMLTRAAEIDYCYKRGLDGGGEFARVKLNVSSQIPKAGVRVTTPQRVKSRVNVTHARVKLVVEPDIGAMTAGEISGSLDFGVRVTGGPVPAAFHDAIARGLDTARQYGLIAGFPVIGLRVTLVDGAYHDLDSTPEAFEIAAIQAFRQLRDRGAPVLVQPQMQVAVVTPEDLASAITADLHRRGATIHGRVSPKAVMPDEPMDGFVIVEASALLANLLGYHRDLARLSGHQAFVALCFERYVPVASFDPPDGTFPSGAAMRSRVRQQLRAISAQARLMPGTGSVSYDDMPKPQA